ncbi:MAG: hypothetical protein QGI64_02540 [Desulfobacterales bacterium]|jgi:hypothetical protein|nr:hypothetical protein [Desulfobacterales bacterium]
MQRVGHGVFAYFMCRLAGLGRFFHQPFKAYLSRAGLLNGINIAGAITSLLTTLFSGAFGYIIFLANSVSSCTRFKVAGLKTPSGSVSFTTPKTTISYRVTSLGLLVKDPHGFIFGQHVLRISIHFYHTYHGSQDNGGQYHDDDNQFGFLHGELN